MKNNTYKGIYAMHKYWGKKPFNEISKFIEQYTRPGETVMDSFCGSGVTLIEALRANRRCVGVDINPIAIKLAKASMTAVDVDEINCTFKQMKQKLQETINSMYRVNFEGQETLVTHTIWKEGEPVEVWYETAAVKKSIRKGQDIDIEMCNHPKVATKWYPDSPMFENSRINVEKDQKVSDLFTPRALVGLSLLLDEIRQIPDEKIRAVFELTLTGTLSQASNLVFVIRGRRKGENGEPLAEVGSWVIGYWVPEEHFEINVWNCFENRFRRILKGEKEIGEIFGDRPAGYFEENVQLIHGSATCIPVEDNTVDYVFIDPPHANRIPYMEQSLMWNAWLGLDEDLRWEDEIIVSEAKDRKNKDKDNFNTLLSQAFGEIKRVLKPGRHFSFAFNCLDDNTWLDTLNLFAAHGFELCDIIPLEYSATSVIQDNRKNALKTDFVLTFQNAGKVSGQSTVPKEITERNMTFSGDNALLEEKIKAILDAHPDVEVYHVMNELFRDTIPQGYIFKVSAIVKKCAEIL